MEVPDAGFAIIRGLCVLLVLTCDWWSRVLTGIPDGSTGRASLLSFVLALQMHLVLTYSWRSHVFIEEIFSRNTAYGKN